MDVVVCSFHPRFHPRISIGLTLCASLFAACSSGDAPAVSVGEEPDAAVVTDGGRMDGGGARETPKLCDQIELDGDFVIEHEKNFTARYRVGEPYRKTVMLFGGEAVLDDNVLSSAYIFALDKTDALMLAQKYADFYLCSSPGGMEAASYIVPYDLVPENCEIYEQLVAALQQYHANAVVGGDRTSLQIDGAPLQLLSVTDDASGRDVAEQISGQDFHLVTAVQQLTGESVLSFGTSN